MGWWKADPVPDPQPPPSSSPSPIAPHPLPPEFAASTDPGAACPVDPKTRAIWLQQAQAKRQASPSSDNKQTHTKLPVSHPPLPIPSSSSSSPSKPTLKATTLSSEECSSDRISQSPNPSQTYPTSRPLSHDRAVSSIPRALPTTPLSASTPLNNESETGTSKSGNWIYPSESQFFNAVMRKQTSSNPTELVSYISNIIPIHNAVNERAWAQIKEWEGDTSAACGGPKLLSFHGLGAGAISPKARMRSLMGYTEPFDRHDWVVERCGGQQVEYVIDFYQGKADPRQLQQQSRGPKGETPLNFHLDVRPKLNSFEGFRMRAERFVGWR